VNSKKRAVFRPGSGCCAIPGPKSEKRRRPEHSPGILVG
jgi:hypothetical protein